MKLQIKIGVLAGTLALAAIPATATAEPIYTPGPEKPAPPPQAKAYGKYCQGKSKKHVKGEKGTEFSRCVKAVAHLRRDERRKEREVARASVATQAAGPPEGVPPHGEAAKGKGPTYTPVPPPPPGPKAGLPEKAKAYGRYCQGKSKKHVKGEKGTEFSRCVNTMAKVATNDDVTPREACKGESRKRVKGEKGTAFSRCVKAAAQLRKDQGEKGV